MFCDSMSVKKLQKKKKNCKLLFIFWLPKIEIHCVTVNRSSFERYYKEVINFVSKCATTRNTFAEHFSAFLRTFIGSFYRQHLALSYF